VAQVKASNSSKLNSLISPRSFKFPGEKLLKKIGGAGGMSHKDKENTLTLSTSSVATRRRSKRHHSLDDLEDSIRRNVSFGRKGNKTRDAIASDSEDDKASVWDGSYGDDTSSSHSSGTDSGTALSLALQVARVRVRVAHILCPWMCACACAVRCGCAQR
jgi:hypothetical protein